MEWSNPFVPVNSMKGLTYYEHYVKILGWMEGKNPLPAPIEASLDPIAACNNRCYYCSSNQYLKGEQPKRWGLDFMEDLFEALTVRGVKAFCWGGREATLNPRLAEATRMGVLCGLEGAIVTNGVHLPPDLAEALLLCSWIGVSVDTVHRLIYKQVRGTDDCDTVWQHIALLAGKKKKTLVSARALVLPETIPTLYDVCYRAREVGCNFALIRPADLERQDLNHGRLNVDVDRVKDIFEKCHELETPDFRVFTVMHKYDDQFHVQHHFKRCLASPLVIQICADKKRYLCVDHRMDPRYEIKGEWGGPEHLELIKSIDPDRDCSRCTWDSYNRQIEEVVINDAMGRNFP